MGLTVGQVVDGDEFQDDVQRNEDYRREFELYEPAEPAGTCAEPSLGSPRNLATATVLVGAGRVLRSSLPDLAIRVTPTLISAGDAVTPARVLVDIDRLDLALAFGEDAQQQVIWTVYSIDTGGNVRAEFTGLLDVLESGSGGVQA